MGGLIIKEVKMPANSLCYADNVPAYMQGQHDPKYESMIMAISAITFLATPHRGTNLAELLDRILRSTIFTNSKQYVSELAKNSFTLQQTQWKIAPYCTKTRHSLVLWNSIYFTWTEKCPNFKQMSAETTVILCWYFKDDTVKGFISTWVLWGDLQGIERRSS